MASWDKIHQPCPCGRSSDAFAVNLDGSGKCFSCGKFFKGNQELEDTNQFTYEYLPRGQLTKETHEFFKVLTAVDADGKPNSVKYDYSDTASKFRVLDKKSFFSKGPIADAGGWGKTFFAPGSAKSITITEGEDDAMAVWQMMGKYPVYSIQNAASAMRNVRADFDYLNSFERVYLCLDNDPPGQAATQVIASIFDPRKVYHVKLGQFKDARDFLEAGKVQEFRNSWYNAGRFLPEGIKSSFKEIDDILDNASKEPGVPFPFPTLTALTGGLKRGKSYLVTGLEGIGKTEFLHATEHYLAKNDADANIGIIHLEEPPDDTIKKQAGYELRQPAHTDDTSVSIDEIKAAFRKVAGREDRIHILAHFGAEEPDILLSKIRFLVAACGCKYIFLDNITILATGRMQESETKELDWLSTRLEMLVKELNFVLVFISHENDSEQTRGSKNISKVCDVWIQMKRDVKHENEYLRRILYLTIFKNRQAWKTGPAGRLIYDPDTSMLTELTEELPI